MSRLVDNYEPSGSQLSAAKMYGMSAREVWNKR